MDAHRHGQGGGTCPPTPENDVKCFLCCKCCLNSADEVFVYYFEKMSSVSGRSAPDPFQGSALNPAGGLPSFIAPHCSPLEKNPAGAYES